MPNSEAKYPRVPVFVKARPSNEWHVTARGWHGVLCGHLKNPDLDGDGHYPIESRLFHPREYVCRRCRKSLDAFQDAGLWEWDA